jgi:radical SAM protein with 4Fe4S-binding SPASM domain
MTQLNVSRYLHFLRVAQEMYIGWNRFFPSTFILNRSALLFLQHIKKKKPLENSGPILAFLEELKKYKFLYEGEVDPSRQEFLDMVQQKLAEIDRRAEDFYRLKQDYEDLKLGNDRCNLACSYCINEEGKPKKYCRPAPEMRLPVRLRIINKCVDQFFARKIANGKRETRISFNGGEILADWPLVKKILDHIRRKYPGMKIDYSINTNMTLLTPEKARFLHRHKFKVSISIDGYKEAHNKTRKYHNGKGSFADVISKVELYRKTCGASNLSAFQGTIADAGDFQPEKVYRMDEYGFNCARLAPNLLGVSQEDAQKKARLMGKFLELNAHYRFQVRELIFTRIKDKINQEAYQFAFNCSGLSTFPKMGIEMNLSTLAVSHLCGFIREVALPFEELHCDIYNPKLWQISFQFIKERMETVFSHCQGCSILGICTGGCILSGIDQQNRLNKGACTYQREMWNIYVKKTFQDRKKKNS